MPQLTIQQAFTLALRHHQAGQLQQAEQLYRQILALQPGHADAMHFLGLIAHQVGQNDMAVDLIRQAIALKPRNSEAYGNLGLALQSQGQLDAAIAAYRQAIALKPNYPEAYSNLGVALQSQGRLDEAVAAYRQAIAHNTHYPQAYSNLGVALQSQGQIDAAIAACFQAIALQPHYPQAYYNLGNAFKEQGQLDKAVAAYKQAVAFKPDYAEAYGNLGAAQKDQGLLDESITAYRQTIALAPDNARMHSNLVYTLHFHPAYDAQALAVEHRLWNLRHAEPLRQFIQPHANDRSPGRRLRVGYVSPDFRVNCQSLFTIPLLAHHDHAAFEIFCYANVARHDDHTRRIAGYADVWRDVRQLKDAALCELIRADRIDLLIDLTMHMGNNRLLVFAHKPAPVQATYLAYCSTTGLETIDYRLSDPYLDPPGMDESVYSEQTIRLPKTYWCYQPIIPPTEIRPLPALEHGHITFGCLNNFCKVSEPTLAVWSKVLQAVSNSQLLLHAHEGSHRQRVLNRFQQDGIDPQRIRFTGLLPIESYFALHQQLDIALDTFPYGGGTTTCDALWMGVPVVSLVGQTAVGRGGLSLLSNLGMPEYAARSEGEYVRIAAALAHDLPRLTYFRATLRQRMEQSPLMDAPRFARDFEAACRHMWNQWCATAR